MKKVNLSLVSIFVVILLFLLTLPATSSWAATYYVDAVYGNDATGKSDNINLPFKTINKINTFFQAGTIVHGDYIKFKMGTTPTEQTFQGRINLYNCSGIAGAPITITNYGSGSYKPQFNSADVLTDHLAVGWTGPNGNGVYTYNAGGNSYFIYEDGYALREASSSACSDGQIFFSGSTIYYKPSSAGPANHLIERCLHGLTFYSAANDYITIDGLRFIREGLYAAADASGSNRTGWIVQDCDFINQGVQFWQGSGITWVNLTVQNCTFDHCHNCSIVLEGGASDNASFNNMHILNNTITCNNTLLKDGLE
ncbi:MAG: hypothetical protein ACHQ2F_05455, partial [Desulfobaccales bacterium]